ncbi:MAG: tandem-95 repeat protein [Candidatus Nealsonbacteria bacterium]|nr:tandem-95 repeat protein [Candidatus Nealsonbacteria bacterium]
MLRSKLFDGLKRLSGPFRTRNPHRHGARRQRGFRRPRLECLERRELLSVAGWVTSATGPDLMGAGDLATDIEGNVYVTGGFSGTADFAPDVTLTSGGGFEGFAAKYGPDGALDWVQSLGAGLDFGTAIAVEAVGDYTNVYIVAGDGDQWRLNGDDGSGSRVHDDNSSLELADIAVDSDGDYYVTGSFSGTITINDTVNHVPITVTSEGYDDIFVAKANSDGLFYWVQHDGGRRSSSGGEGITVDDEGNVYVTGNLDDSKGVQTRGYSDIFGWKLDSTDGSFVWTQRAGSDSPHAGEYGDVGYEVAVDNNGGVYVTGTLGAADGRDGFADFGYFEIDVWSDVVSNYGFVTKLSDDTGEFRWATRFGADQANSRYGGSSLDFDSAGNLYLAGWANNGGGTYGDFTLAERDGAPSWGFLATVNTVSGEFEALPGEFEPVQRVGTSGNPGADMLAFDPDDNLFMAGWLRGKDQEFLTGDVLSSTPGTYEPYEPTSDMVLVKLFADDSTNTPPVAGNDFVSTPEDAPVTVDVLANDSDPDLGDVVQVSGITQGANGSVVNNGGASVTYTPNADFNGEDTFTYTISDGNGGTDTTMVTVDVTPVADPPVAVDDVASTTVDTSVVIDVLANDYDPDGDDISVISVTNGSGGTVVHDDGSVTYTPNEGFIGPDTFTYTISDGYGGEAIGYVNVEVNAIPSTMEFTSTALPINIGDLKTVSSSIAISDTGVTIASLTIRIDLTHSEDTDLTAQIISPTGSILTIDVPIVSGNYGYEYIVSDDVTGLVLDGTWTLQVTDGVKNRMRGWLTEWTMAVEPTPIESASSSAATDAALLAWGDLDSSDDDDSDILTETLINDLASVCRESDDLAVGAGVCGPI